MATKQPDDSVKLLDELYREDAAHALEEECVPGEAAQRLAALGQALAVDLEGSGVVVQALPVELDTDRIALLPRDRLLSTVVRLATARGELLDEETARASDDDLRATIRRLR